MFELRTGTSFQYVAYRANSEAMLAMMRGDIVMSLSDTGPAAGPLQDGRVRALAVTTMKRLPSWPEVPTMAEAGVKDMGVEFWQGLVAPAGTPAAVVRKLQDESMAIAQLDDVRQKLATQETIPVGSTSEDYARVIAKELLQWAEVVKRGNIKIE
jgi:tripartite-type tricarboxylate transporter receptor subunit TctC